MTGGAGFIGSNLVDALIARGDQVTILDDLSTGRLSNLSGALEAGAALLEGSVADPRAVAEALATARPEVIFHLAAQIDVRRAVDDPAFDATVNVVGTATLLEAARHMGVRRVVLASTGGAIYGDADVVPTPEGTEPKPLSPYAASKASAEVYMGLYRRLYGLSTFSLRLANVYGPRQDPKGEAGVCAIYCGRARRGRARHGLRRRAPDARLRLRRRRGGGLHGRRRSRRGRLLQRLHRPRDDGARARRGARAGARARPGAGRRGAPLVPGPGGRRAPDRLERPDVAARRAGADGRRPRAPRWRPRRPPPDARRAVTSRGGARRRGPAACASPSARWRWRARRTARWAGRTRRRGPACPPG